jgi:hypothetical protein
VWTAFRSWPSWARLTAYAVVALLVLAFVSAANGSGTSKESDTTASTHPTPVHHTTTSTLRTTTTTGDEEGTIDPTASTVPIPPPPPEAIPPAGTPCRSNPLANVYHPYRLRVIEACATVSGSVTVVRHEDDGDIHFDLALDAQYANLLVPGNVSRQHGWLVIEIVPADGPGCTAGQPPRAPSGTYDYGICTGASVATPAVGAHVAVTGPYVMDLAHGWTEIHPAWSVGAPGGATPSPPVVPTPTASPPDTPTGTVVHPGAFCTPAGATGVTAAGTAMVCRTSPTDSRLRWRAA